MQTDKSTIVIAGAGPSGLTLAIELNRLGIPCAIFDKASGPAPMHESRALAFNSRSQSLLATSGVTESIETVSHPVERVRFCWKGQMRNEISIKADSQQPNKMLIVRQGQIERKMLEHLQQKGIEVSWNTELAEFTEQNDHVTTTFMGQKGEHHKIQCRYLVGCDGAHSFVRRNGGYTFEGETDPQLWSLADVSTTDDRFAHTLTADLSPGKAFATMPIENNLVRLIHNGPDLLQRHPFAHLQTNVHWQSEFKVSYRLVKLFNRGRTFLCGDAAHIHSPVGGRGMNLGIEDAATLAWLLQKNSELDYTSLRRPVAVKVLKLTHNQTSQMNASSMVSSILKQFGPKLISLAPVKRSFLKTLHGLDTPDPVWLD
ncbi:MAG: FAD-dependent monooxygenase [Gammaproteobacteria bacterium]|nr:FAD-dependent monooxygenase [Gammaproteobacteria bacterium]